jgi:hypothetical protein
VVLCVDYAAEVWRELEARRAGARQGVPPPSGDGQGQFEGMEVDVDLVEFGVGL